MVSSFFTLPAFKGLSRELLSREGEKTTVVRVTTLLTKFESSLLPTRFLNAFQQYMRRLFTEFIRTKVGHTSLLIITSHL